MATSVTFQLSTRYSSRTDNRTQKPSQQTL